ncbi:MAG: leader peptidase (prepilin peptidase)/N-methyltransferase [Limisphaerales bacterium]|jgi:leader peptidase (prepilin peptidase)/N-methyltransferase
MNDFALDFWTRAPFVFWSAVFFVFGAVVGSFLNVCIHRMPLDLSLAKPGSQCPKCSFAIPWRLNIPIVSWLWLRGKCRQCAAPISPRYLGVELLTGLAFLASWLVFGEQTTPGVLLAVTWGFVLAGLIVATFIDLEHFIIPDQITLGGVAVGFIVSAALPALHHLERPADSLMASGLGILVGAGAVFAVLQLGKLLFGRMRVPLGEGESATFTESALHLPGEVVPFEEIFFRNSDTIRLHAKRLELVDRCHMNMDVALSPKRLLIGGESFDPETVPFIKVETDELVIPREAMGFGDVKFMAAIGAFVGWQGALFSLMASAVIGAVVGVGLIAIGRRDWSERLPYGPYISLAAVIWMFFREEILAVWLPLGQ